MTGPEDSIRVTAGRRGHDVGGTTGRRGLPVPSEALALAATVLAILIAAAVADNFESPLAWGFVTFLVAIFILSRGLVKRGTGRGEDGL